MAKTLLIVDDERTIRVSIKAALAGEGYNFIEADSGKEALKKAEKNTPDLILLDIMMPGMDGFEVLKQLKKNPLTKRIPVIMITAKSDIQSVEKSHSEGAIYYITKPFIVSNLVKKVNFVAKKELDLAKYDVKRLT